MKLAPIPDMSSLSDEQKKKIVNKLLLDTFNEFMGVFYSLGYQEKIWGKWTNAITNETFEIEFRKVDTKNQFGL